MELNNYETHLKRRLLGLEKANVIKAWWAHPEAKKMAGGWGVGGQKLSNWQVDAGQVLWAKWRWEGIDPNLFNLHTARKKLSHHCNNCSLKGYGFTCKSIHLLRVFHYRVQVNIYLWGRHSVSVNVKSSTSFQLQLFKQFEIPSVSQTVVLFELFCYTAYLPVWRTLVNLQ